MRLDTGELLTETSLEAYREQVTARETVRALVTEDAATIAERLFRRR